MRIRHSLVLHSFCIVVAVAMFGPSSAQLDTAFAQSSDTEPVEQPILHPLWKREFRIPVESPYISMNPKVPTGVTYVYYGGGVHTLWTVLLRTDHEAWLLRDLRDWDHPWIDNSPFKDPSKEQATSLDDVRLLHLERDNDLAWGWSIRTVYELIPPSKEPVSGNVPWDQKVTDAGQWVPSSQQSWLTPFVSSQHPLLDREDADDKPWEDPNLNAGALAKHSGWSGNTDDHEYWDAAIVKLSGEDRLTGYDWFLSVAEPGKSFCDVSRHDPESEESVDLDEDYPVLFPVLVLRIETPFDVAYCRLISIHPQPELIDDIVLPELEQEEAPGSDSGE